MGRHSHEAHMNGTGRATWFFPRVNGLELAVSMLVSFAVIFLFCLIDSRNFDWFLIPLFLSGVLCAADAIPWIRGTIDPFDPVGLIGFLGLHFFLVAPLLLASSGPTFRVEDTVVPESRYWLGLMAWLNLGGLVLYKFGSHLAESAKGTFPRSTWGLGGRRARIAVAVALAACVVSQIIYFVGSGGFATYINERVHGALGDSPTGYGPLMVLGQYVPILVLMAMTFLRKGGSSTLASPLNVALVLVVVISMQFLITGLSGSRNSVIWTGFWTLGVIHFFWRPLSAKYMLLGIIPFIVYMYFLGFYKSLGGQVLDYAKDSESLTDMEAASHRDFFSLFVGDLSRADVQAAEAYVIVTKPWEYGLSYGSTYLWSFAPFIPKALWAGRPEDPGKVIAGTALLDGPRSYRTEDYVLRHSLGRRSTRIYGLAGEAMLNFGLLGVPIAYLLWGLIVGRTRHFIERLDTHDIRLFLVPFVVMLLFLLLVNDSDNIAAISLFKFALPLVVLVVSATKSDPTGEVAADSQVAASSHADGSL